MDEHEIDALLRQAFRRADDGVGTDDLLLSLFTDGGGTVDRREAVVSLTTDGDPALVGVRSAGLLDDRQIVAEAGDVTVVLDVLRTPDGLLEVRGQVLGLDGPCAVQLLADELEVALTVTDELDEFQLGPVAAGRYELVLAAGHREVSVPVDLD